MATKLTKPIDREIPCGIGAYHAPFVFTFAPEGLSARVKGRSDLRGPIAWDIVFAWLVSRALRDQLGDDARLSAIAERNPTFSRALASDTPITAEMAVGGPDD